MCVRVFWRRGGGGSVMYGRASKMKSWLAELKQLVTTQYTPHRSRCNHKVTGYANPRRACLDFKGRPGRPFIFRASKNVPLHAPRVCVKSTKLF